MASETNVGESHFQKLESMYENAPCNDYTKPKISISEGAAEVLIPIGAHLFHSAGAVHGSYYFKALDDAAFFAANSVVPDQFVLTVSFHIQLLQPVSSGTIRGVGKVVRSGKNLIFAESVLFNEGGEELARGNGVFAKSRHPLEPSVGYC